MRPVDVRRIRAGTVTLEVAEGGAGGRPLLLVHGFTGSKDDLSEGIDGLAAGGWHAVAPDLRGHGGSDHPRGEASYTPTLLVEDLLALAGALGWDRFALVGHSMGGALAQRLTIHHTERVSALVLVGTFCGPVRGLEQGHIDLGSAIVRQGGMEALAPALAARREADPHAVAARERLERARPGYSDAADQRLLACSPDMWLALAPRFLSWPATADALAATKVPTLVITGSEDGTMRADCEHLATSVPDARLVVVDGAGHSPQLEQPALCWDEIRAFLGDATAAAEAG